MTVDAPLMTYDFISPRKIVFGRGRSQEIGQIGRSLGDCCFIVCGSKTLTENGILDNLSQRLHEAGVALLGTHTISREPEVEDVDHVSTIVRVFGLKGRTFIMGLGGGSAMDLAKAVAAMAVNHETDTVADYLEGVGKGLTIKNDPLPVLAVPTTAGTGAEATKNAVISSYDPLFKKSLRDERLLPRIALVDPELTMSATREVTVASGMDAITQLIESYISRRSQPIPCALAEQGLTLAMPSILEVVEDGRWRPAREAMSQAALLSGLCLANSGLGMAHGVAAALGVHCRVPHGLACAMMLPVALRSNISVCTSELAQLGRVVLHISPELSETKTAEKFVEEIESIGRQLGVPSRLSELGVPADKIPEIVKSSQGNSMRGNPRQFTEEELTAILESVQ